MAYGIRNTVFFLNLDYALKTFFLAKGSLEWGWIDVA
jgi:hypothetical protein